MADLILPIMAPGPGGTSRHEALGCWAREDELPSWVGGSHPWLTACGADPAIDLGLCAHHLVTIFPESRSNAS